MTLTDKQRALIERKLHWQAGTFTTEEMQTLKTADFDRRQASTIIELLFTLDAHKGGITDTYTNAVNSIKQIIKLYETP